MRWYEKLGYNQKVAIIIHADDAGSSLGANYGIAECYSKGLLTSASVMVTGSHFDDFIATVAHEIDDIGLHLTLDVRDILSLEKVRSSLQEQFSSMSRFRSPSHLDSHGGLVFLSFEASQEYLRLSTRNSVPALVAINADIEQNYPGFVKAVGEYNFPVLDNVFLMPKKMSPEQKLEWACEFFGKLSPGLYEWIVHPHLDDDFLDVDGYGDVWALTHPKLIRLLRRKQYVLTNWVDVWNRYRHRGGGSSLTFPA